MSPSLLTPPEPRPLWSDDGASPAPPPPAPSAPRRRRRAPLAAALVACSLLGGGMSVAVLAATGRLDGGNTTTTVVKTSTISDSSSGLNAESLYATASPGVVDITTGDGSGTGFVADTDGHIITAAHVVEGASSITVKLADGTTRSATVLSQDDATDVAVLKIDASGLTLHPLTLGSSSGVDVGAAVAAIGDPFGYERSISTGIVSGVDRTIQAPNGFTVAHALQIDAAINPGNSGGPILDASGAVIGIADQIAGSADQSSGVGFAVPIDLIKSELTALEAGQSVEHAYLGISSSDAGGGVAVASVTGPAAAGGLRDGDVITKLGDATIADQNDLVAAIATHKPGDTVAVTVKRGSDTVSLQVTLGTQPARSGG